MAVELPKAIADYFTADNKLAADAVSECFTPDAVVRDEGNVYTGRDAIQQWKSESSKKYDYSVEPVSVALQGDKTVVTSQLVGNFPGSPVDLRYFFVLAGEKIAELEVLP